MSRKIALLLVALVAVLAVPLIAGSSEKSEKGKLVRVETKKVCMVNEAVFERDQIPVEVDGRVYYGCCEMCKTRLAEDPAMRIAIDPVSRKAVDKAVAVIAADETGKVFYFENEKNLAKYNSR